MKYLYNVQIFFGISLCFRIHPHLFCYLMQSTERQMNGTAFHIVLWRIYEGSRKH